MKVDHLVIGIGVNVHARDLPEEIAPLATSIALEGAIADRAELLAEILARIDRDLEHVAHRGLGLVHARLAEHDALRNAEVQSADGEAGVAAGIDIDGRLRMRRTRDGVVVSLNAGEVRLVK
jgi:BirA family biotin operon repressor/biotin-[acetyl-CoA-carboxylase] ligase